LTEVRGKVIDKISSKLELNTVQKQKLGSTSKPAICLKNVALSRVSSHTASLHWLRIRSRICSAQIAFSLGRWDLPRVLLHPLRTSEIFRYAQRPEAAKSSQCGA